MGVWACGTSLRLAESACWWAIQTGSLRFLSTVKQATQACIDLEQQLRERQRALEAAQAAERETHAAWEEKK